MGLDRYVMTCVYQYRIVYTVLAALRPLCARPLNPPPLILFFFLIFIIVTERERERGAETQAEGEAGSMHREPDVGFDPGSPGSLPGPKAGAKPLCHPGIPQNNFNREKSSKIKLSRDKFRVAYFGIKK